MVEARVSAPTKEKKNVLERFSGLTPKAAIAMSLPYVAEGPTVDYRGEAPLSWRDMDTMASMVSAGSSIG
jgi:hypothetical protein